MNKRILVITSKYKHHSDQAGYIQLSKFIKPTYIIGVDETSGIKTPYFLRAYKWLYEFIGWWKYRDKIDLVHIYYGEEYYRFSSYLFKNIPVIVTFHQPKEKLKYEVKKGGDGGRVYRLTHRLTKNRFEKLTAAIILEENQREVLKEVMPKSKIHVVYHGVYLNQNSGINSMNSCRDSNFVISLGNWLRDWNFFEKVLMEASLRFPDLKFILINKNIDLQILSKLTKYKNFIYEKDVYENDLIIFLKKAKFVFLPLKSAAGNNAVMESLALGTSILIPDIFHEEFQLKCKGTFFYKFDDLDDCMFQIYQLLNINPEENILIENSSLDLISKFSWEEISKRTLEVYLECCLLNRKMSM